MSKWLLIIVMIIYCGVSISYLLSGNKGLALVFFAYAVANLGFIL